MICAIFCIICFLVGIWCGMGWQKPFVRMIDQARAERDDYRRQFIELHKWTDGLIEKVEKLLANNVTKQLSSIDENRPAAR